MLTFRRTSDLDLVRGILTHAPVWPHIGDDFAGRPEEFQPNADPRIWYVCALEDGNLVGLFTFLPRSIVLWEVHVVLLRAKRTRGTILSREALRWMCAQSTAERFRAEIPGSNKMALLLGHRVMEYLGSDFAAFQKHGKLFDLELFGISKRDLCPAS